MLAVTKSGPVPQRPERLWEPDTPSSISLAPGRQSSARTTAPARGSTVPLDEAIHYPDGEGRS
jgi:hypothetical protein